jgi:hypothetical protein
MRSAEMIHRASSRSNYAQGASISSLVRTNVYAISFNPMAERKAEGEAKYTKAQARQREAENSFENIARKWWVWWSIGKSPRHTNTVMRRLKADVFSRRLATSSLTR